MGRSWTLSYVQVCFSLVRAGPNRADTGHDHVTKRFSLEKFFFLRMIGYGVPVLVSFPALCQNAEGDALEVGTLALTHGFKCFSSWSLW